MIGVISKASEKEIIREFFELFKTPWEFYRDDRTYDVVVATADTVSEINAKRIIFFKSEKSVFDDKRKIKVKSQIEMPILTYNGRYFPIFRKSLVFESSENDLIKIKGTQKTAGIEVREKEKRIFRVGFDLFQEIAFLLTDGQPAEHAFIPTLEIYISMLRDWILKSGCPLIEIPPVPAGHDFIACLTHDVDFAGIRNHRFDHTIFGFIYRAIFGSVVRFFKGKGSISRVVRNWKAVLSLPLVHLKLVKDFWMQFDRYVEMESGHGSTFFVIPFKNRPGTGISGKIQKKRAVRYDVSDIRQEIDRLIAAHCEVGLHGIDAWQDSKKGRKEFERIRNSIEKPEIGVRMHWLYFSEHSPKLLEKAGFCYDSSLGYNETIGFKGGTSQVFIPPGAEELMELPLHIQDTALFYPDRMNLDEEEARCLISQLFETASLYGGVLTLNWHQRSIAPERLWDDVYFDVLKEIKQRNAWVGTARQVVMWFKKRRSVSFEEVELVNDNLNVKLSTAENHEIPDLLLRIHKPKTDRVSGDHGSSKEPAYSDFPFAGKLHIEFPVETNDIQEEALETAA